MNSITNAFKNKKALIAFITGGDPDLATTEKLILGLEKAGVDLIEIGIPFSDPVAEGPVIQEADLRALKNGCTTDKLLEMVNSVKQKINIPLLFMTYANPVYSYGKEKFFSNCEKAGIGGIIIPDVPFEEKGEFEASADQYNICVISMIAPTSGERIEKIAKEAKGFIYCVSSLGVTGTRGEIKSGIGPLIEKVKKITDVPCAVGFGISTPRQARETAAFADGVIIGSAIVRVIAEHGRDCVEPVRQFAQSIKQAIK